MKHIMRIACDVPEKRDLPEVDMDRKGSKAPHDDQASSVWVL